MRCVRKKSVFILLATIGFLYIFASLKDAGNEISFTHALFLGSEQSISNDEACVAKNFFAYTKVHKTGSGTMHNILAKLIITKGLFLAFSPKNPNFFSCFPDKESIKTPTNKEFKTFNAFIDHARFNQQSLLEFLPKQTKFITSLRHPWSHSKSAFHHFHMSSSDSLETYLLGQTKPVVDQSAKCSQTSGMFSSAFNFQSYSLGYSLVTLNNITDFKDFLMEIDDKFDMVLILEEIEKSMVLLKRLMCWEMKDVLSIQTHISKQQKNVIADTSDIVRAKAIHQNISQLDYILYDHFLNKLYREIEKQADDFQDEVDVYISHNQIFKEFCDSMCKDFSGYSINNLNGIRKKLQTSKTFEQTKFNSAYQVTYIDCLQLQIKELVLKTVIKIHHWPNACTDIKFGKSIGVNAEDCDGDKYVIPGVPANYFKKSVLNTDACLGHTYGT